MLAAIPKTNKTATATATAVLRFTHGQQSRVSIHGPWKRTGGLEKVNEITNAMYEVPKNEQMQDVMVDDMVGVLEGEQTEDDKTDVRKQEHNETAGEVTTNGAAVQLLGLAKNRVNKFYNLQVLDNGGGRFTFFMK